MTILNGSHFSLKGSKENKENKENKWDREDTDFGSTYKSVSSKKAVSRNLIIYAGESPKYKTQKKGGNPRGRVERPSDNSATEKSPKYVRVSPCKIPKYTYESNAIEQALSKVR